MPQKTYYPDPKAVQAARRWHHMDADGAVLGRLATRAASLLKGKHKPDFTPWIDCGDFVVVTNASRVKLTGKKIEQKFYFSHSGWPKGAKTTPVKRQLERDPRVVVYRAVRRMLDDNRFRAPQMTRLKIYRGPEHPHAAQFAAGTAAHRAKDKAAAVQAAIDQGVAGSEPAAQGPNETGIAGAAPGSAAATEA